MTKVDYLRQRRRQQQDGTWAPRPYHRLTVLDQARCLQLARDDPSRPWSQIARALGLPSRNVQLYLRARLGAKRGTAHEHRHEARSCCPQCHTPIPHLITQRYRCQSCGQLIAKSA